MSAEFGPVKVTISDPESGEVLGEKILDDDYLIITAGNRAVAHVNAHSNGTHVCTIKVVDA